jgi:hypothetical protein
LALVNTPNHNAVIDSNILTGLVVAVVIVVVVVVVIGLRVVKGKGRWIETGTNKCLRTYTRICMCVCTVEITPAHVIIVILDG